MIQFIEQYKELVPVIAGGMILMLFACLYIKSKFISLLNLDDIYVKKLIVPNVIKKFMHILMKEEKKFLISLMSRAKYYPK